MSIDLLKIVATLCKAMTRKTQKRGLKGSSTHGTRCTEERTKTINGIKSGNITVFAEETTSTAQAEGQKPILHVFVYA